MAMIGADVGALRGLGSRLASAADTLDNARSQVSGRVQSTVWVGPNADRFREEWSSVHVGRLIASATLLRDASRTVGSNADAQEHTSSDALDRLISRGRDLWNSTTDFFGDLWPGGGDGGLRDWAEDQAQTLADLRDLSEAEQLAWWEGLTDEQRAALLDHLPERLYDLDGLPSDVRHEARAAVLEDFADKVVLSSTSEEYKAEAEAWIISLEASGSAEIAELANGDYRVKLNAEGELAVRLGEDDAGGEASVGLGAGITDTYTFDSLDEAQDFVDGLKDAVVPDTGELIGHTLNPLSSPATDAIADGFNYLEGFDGSRDARVGNLELTGALEADLQGVEIEIEGAAGATHDFDSGRNTVYLEAGVELDVGETPYGGVSGSADLDVRGELIIEDGQAVGLKVTGSAQATGGAEITEFLNESGLAPPAGGADVPSINVTSEAGGEVAFTAEVDLTNPVFQNEVQNLVEGLGSGDVSVDALGGVLRETDVVVQQNVVTETKTEVDAVVVSASAEYGTSDNVVTYISPSGGGSPIVVTPGDFE